MAVESVRWPRWSGDRGSPRRERTEAARRLKEARSLGPVEPGPPESEMPLLDEWIEEVGEDTVIAVVEDTKRRVEDGTLPAFSDRKDLLAYIRRARRQSA